MDGYNKGEASEDTDALQVEITALSKTKARQGYRDDVEEDFDDECNSVSQFPATNIPVATLIHLPTADPVEMTTKVATQTS